jgi:hypothetical protein
MGGEENILKGRAGQSPVNLWQLSYLKIYPELRLRRLPQAVEHLPSKCRALSSTPRTCKTNKNV